MPVSVMTALLASRAREHQREPETDAGDRGQHDGARAGLAAQLGAAGRHGAERARARAPRASPTSGRSPATSRPRTGTTMPMAAIGETTPIVPMRARRRSRRARPVPTIPAPPPTAPTPTDPRPAPVVDGHEADRHAARTPARPPTTTRAGASASAGRRRSRLYPTTATRGVRGAAAIPRRVARRAPSRRAVHRRAVAPYAALMAAGPSPDDAPEPFPARCERCGVPGCAPRSARRGAVAPAAGARTRLR